MTSWTAFLSNFLLTLLCDLSVTSKMHSDLLTTHIMYLVDFTFEIGFSIQNSPKGLLLSLPLGSFIRNCVIGANFVTYVHIFLVLHIFTFTTTIINTIQFSICRYLVYTAWCKNLSMVSFFQAIPSWNTAWWVKVKFTHQKYTQLFKM